MKWLKENWFKLSIVLIVFLTGLSIALYFLVYIPHQNETKRFDDLRKEELARQAKEDQDKRDYIAKRKKDCFDFYDKEKSNWSNVTGQEYDEVNDKCYVTYRSETEWKNTNCKDISPSALEIGIFSPEWRDAYNNYTDCLNKQFRKEF